jgi:hypothetical protein
LCSFHQRERGKRRTRTGHYHNSALLCPSLQGRQPCLYFSSQPPTLFSISFCSCFFISLISHIETKQAITDIANTFFSKHSRKRKASWLFLSVCEGRDRSSSVLQFLCLFLSFGLITNMALAFFLPEKGRARAYDVEHLFAGKMQDCLTDGWLVRLCRRRVFEQGIS